MSCVNILVALILTIAARHTFARTINSLPPRCKPMAQFNTKCCAFHTTNRINVIARKNVGTWRHQTARSDFVKAKNRRLQISASSTDDDRNTDKLSFDDDIKRRIIASKLDDSTTVLFSNSKDKKEENETFEFAATNTVNARLMKELETSISATSNPGVKNESLKKIGGIFNGGRVRSDEERRRALKEARDLNGVNPFVCLGASSACFALSFALWKATSIITEYLTMNPIESELYVVQRIAAVLRNVVIGITSLGSGFCGVIGFGLLLLGFRVAYGVYVTGELDPTPPKVKSTGGVDRGYDPQALEDFNFMDAFDLMMGKKPNRKV